LKTADGQPSVSSNLTVSARNQIKTRLPRRFFISFYQRIYHSNQLWLRLNGLHWSGDSHWQRGSDNASERGAKRRPAQDCLRTSIQNWVWKPLTTPRDRTETAALAHDPRLTPSSLSVTHIEAMLTPFFSSSCPSKTSRRQQWTMPLGKPYNSLAQATTDFTVQVAVFEMARVRGHTVFPLQSRWNYRSASSVTHVCSAFLTPSMSHRLAWSRAASGAMTTT